MRQENAHEIQHSLTYTVSYRSACLKRENIRTGVVSHFLEFLAGRKFSGRIEMQILYVPNMYEIRGSTHSTITKKESFFFLFFEMPNRKAFTFYKNVFGKF